MGSSLSNTEASVYNSQGFEMGAHVHNDCVNFTSFSNLDASYIAQLQQFRTMYPSLQPQTTHRFHCIVWSDWLTQAKVELSHGMRYSLDYYYWPPNWVNGTPGLFTGSGMPMRFADSNGDLIDIYQGVTQLVNENGIDYALNVNTLLDNALGSRGYYGFFGTHDDYRDVAYSDIIINAARTRNVPIISAKQMLTWLDGRNGSSFGTISWSNNELVFPITVLDGARNLKTMVPANSQTGQLLSITRNGNAIPFEVQTIKGMQYAFFDAPVGTNAYIARYSGGGTSPSVTTQPASQTTCAQSSVSFVSAASGNPAPTVQWQSSNDGTNWTNINGATNSTLTFATTTSDNNKQYRAVWSNSGGTVSSNPATLTVNTIPATPLVNVVNNCGNSVLTASNFSGNLLWSTGATTASITVTTAGTYTVTQTVNGCTSPSGSGIAAPLNSSVAAPSVNVVNNCGSSVLTASNFTGTLLWNTGATTASITVTTAGTYTVTQTVNGCTSPSGSGIAAPLNSSVVAPSVAVVNNCGNSVLTASGFTGSLLWSTGATTASITVTTAGTYTVTQTVNGCTSPSGSGVAAPNPTPVLTSSLTSSVTSGVLFIYTPVSTVSGTSFTWNRAAVTGISNVAASGSASIAETLVNITTSPVNVTYVYTLIANGCTNTQNVVVTVNPSQGGVNCVINGAITSSFNSTAIPAGSYIWFNSVFDRGSIGTGTETVTFNVTNSVITFTANSQQFTLNVPNARIRFDASASTATTQFVNNIWETVVPRSYSGYVFMGGLSYLVPTNLPGGISNIQWRANISIDRTGVSLTWRWAAAVYSSFADHAGIIVKPTNSISLSPFLNSDRAGTPQNFKAFVVRGAKGNGGTNYTGNYSSTSTAACSVPTGQRLAGSIVLTDEFLANGKLDVKVIPNPSTSYFSLVIKGSRENPVTVRILDMLGQVIERHEKVASSTVLNVGHKWAAGSYFAEIRQGDQRKVVKMVKIK